MTIPWNKVLKPWFDVEHHRSSLSQGVFCEDCWAGSSRVENSHPFAKLYSRKNSETRRRQRRDELKLYIFSSLLFESNHDFMDRPIHVDPKSYPSNPLTKTSYRKRARGLAQIGMAWEPNFLNQPSVPKVYHHH